MRSCARPFLITLFGAWATAACGLVPTDLFDQRTCAIGALSPDGSLLVYSVGVYDRELGRTLETVRLRDLETGVQQVLFTPDDRAGGFVFAPGGLALAFTRDTEAGTEVWLMNADGTERRRVAGPGDFGALVWSPDGTAVAHVVDDRDPRYEGVPGEITVADDLGWRTLDRGEREGRLRQVHVLDLATGEDRALATPNLDVREVVWSPDGLRLAISAKHRRDLNRTLNTDLYLLELRGDGTLRRFTDNPGPDEHPIWFDDGAIACQSHADSLHESEPATIVIRDVASGRETDRLLQDFDNCVWGLWRHEGAYYVRGAARGSAAIFRAEGRQGRLLGKLGWNCSDIRFGGTRAIVLATSQTSPGALFDLDLESGSRALLLDPNERWSQRVGLVDPQHFTVAVAGRTIDAWIFLPDDWEPGLRLPTVLSIHGGPEWMYGGYFLPEFHVLPTFGYAVLAANPTGSTGYGREHMNDVRGDWTGRPARELLAVVDRAVAEGWAEPDRLAVMGGSYGGHLAAALTTQTDRFRAAAVDRMYPQLESFWGATDQKWFPEWEFGGRPFDPGAREAYLRNDPFRDVARVVTPTLISHGLRDFRCPESGSLIWYSALQSQGVPTRLLRFHDEGHGIRDRANQVFYLEQLLAWFERHVLGAGVHD
ncbi:MAG TPA: S9 family peptidase [Candidatus Krumholzibacteria bacterium]|nr:S9 family peptidase [Candidatus Krumholzibacteria bacterium]HPD70769.1 S9 family peptidase [Candidatus Krumholzibacteria bacterium]HRY39531.1 S9 family peptidase [Candidatus Krumholzibacteria bacterium]